MSGRWDAGSQTWLPAERLPDAGPLRDEAAEAAHLQLWLSDLTDEERAEYLLETCGAVLGEN